MKKTWFVAESIPTMNYTVMLPVFAEYGRFIARQGGGDYFNEVIWIFRDSNADLCYAREDFETGINFLLKKALKNPAWPEKLNQSIFQYAKDYFNFAKKLENKDFSKSSNSRLLKIYWRLVMNYQRKSHNSGQITTWLIDAEKNLFSNHLLNLLKEKIDASRQKVNLAETFAWLTTPNRPGFLDRESREFLKIAGIFNRDKMAKKIVLVNEPARISSVLKLKRPKLEDLMRRHYKKYLWIYYTYQGPVLEPDYFYEILRGIFKTGDLKKFQVQRAGRFKEIKKQRADLFKKLKFSRAEIRFFDIAADIVYLKAFRKDCMYFGSYVTDKVSKEIARRLNLTLKQVRYFAYWEMKDALLKNKFKVDVLNQRYKFSVVYTDSFRPKIYTGKAAQKFLNNLRFEKQDLTEIKELKGLTAYPGKVKGIVKIIETADDLKKMNQGDILLSETTYPALVPAMKKAAAIVTNVGGLTCHAAIVARELKIPCVIGTKIATRVLKDGDKVEVDANEGWVRKL